MQTILTEDGDSTVAILPDALMKKAGFNLDDPLELVVEDGKLIITKASETFED